MTNSTIIFPKWVKTSKCATHSHRLIYGNNSYTGHDPRHGIRILESRTLRVDSRKRHSHINCVAVHTTVIR